MYVTTLDRPQSLPTSSPITTSPSLSPVTNIEKPCLRMLVDVVTGFAPVLNIQLSVLGSMPEGRVYLSAVHLVKATTQACKLHSQARHALDRKQQIEATSGKSTMQTHAGLPVGYWASNYPPLSHHKPNNPLAACQLVASTSHYIWCAKPLTTTGICTDDNTAVNRHSSVQETWCVPVDDNSHWE